MSVTFDFERRQRIGLPESVYCPGKSAAVIEHLVRTLHRRRDPILFTRMAPEQFSALETKLRDLLDYEAVSKTALLNGAHARVRAASVAVVTAGTSDIPVAQEACRTLHYLGIRSVLIPDVGVAGPWRLRARLPAISKNKVVIVAAGMDGALISVVGASTRRPVIALPTSQGYGAGHAGRAALASALSSCAPGVTVVNVDNGYGAACAAARILGLS